MKSGCWHVRTAFKQPAGFLRSGWRPSVGEKPDRASPFIEDPAIEDAPPPGWPARPVATDNAPIAKPISSEIANRFMRDLLRTPLH
jgi:hypothetical protein